MHTVYCMNCVWVRLPYKYEVNQVLSMILIYNHRRIIALNTYLFKKLTHKILFIIRYNIDTFYRLYKPMENFSFYIIIPSRFHTSFSSYVCVETLLEGPEINLETPFFMAYSKFRILLDIIFICFLLWFLLFSV